MISKLYTEQIFSNKTAELKVGGTMPQSIHRCPVLKPKDQLDMQYTAHVFINMIMERIIPQSEVQDAKDEQFNRFVHTKSLIAYDRVLIYGAPGVDR